MPSLLQPLLLEIAQATDRQLARQVQYLKIENQILRNKLPKRITVTEVECRRLVRYAQRLGRALHRLTTIVAPSTLLRSRSAARRRDLGRVLEAACRFALADRLLLAQGADDDWLSGCRCADLPARADPARDPLAADAASGYAWAVAQAREFVAQARSQGLTVGEVQCDRDTKFLQAFADDLRGQRVRLWKLPYRAPNTNAYVERFIQSIQQECLDRFVIRGLQHLRVFCREFLAYYHQERPHQGLDNQLPGARRPRLRPPKRTARIADEVVPLPEVRCK